MRYTLSLFLILAVFWGLNSSNDANLLLVLGFFSVLLVLLISQKMKLPDKESVPLHLVFRIFPFYCWLVKEIILGCLYVLKKVLSGKDTLTPTVFTISLNFKHPLSEVIFANSITLVPGTLCLNLSEGKVQVHAISQELADQLMTGDLARRIKRLE